MIHRICPIETSAYQSDSQNGSKLSWSLELPFYIKLAFPSVKNSNVTSHIYVDASQEKRANREWDMC